MFFLWMFAAESDDDFCNVFPDDAGAISVTRSMIPVSSESSKKRGKVEDCLITSFHFGNEEICSVSGDAFIKCGTNEVLNFSPDGAIKKVFGTSKKLWRLFLKQKQLWMCSVLKTKESSVRTYFLNELGQDDRAFWEGAEEPVIFQDPQTEEFYYTPKPYFPYIERVGDRKRIMPHFHACGVINGYVLLYALNHKEEMFLSKAVKFDEPAKFVPCYPELMFSECYVIGVDRIILYNKDLSSNQVFIEEVQFDEKDGFRVINNFSLDESSEVIGYHNNVVVFKNNQGIHIRGFKTGRVINCTIPRSEKILQASLSGGSVSFITSTPVGKHLQDFKLHHIVLGHGGE